MPTAPSSSSKSLYCCRGYLCSFFLCAPPGFVFIFAACWGLVRKWGQGCCHFGLRSTCNSQKFIFSFEIQLQLTSNDGHVSFFSVQTVFVFLFFVFFSWTCELASAVCYCIYLAVLSYRRNICCSFFSRRIVLESNLSTWSLGSITFGLQVGGVKTTKCFRVSDRLVPSGFYSLHDLFIREKVAPWSLHSSYQKHISLKSYHADGWRLVLGFKMCL